MSTSPQPSPSPRVRNLTRWGIPFHYAPPLIVTAIGIAMLSVGGVVGGFGGWVLAVALPIAIGAFLRSPWFALVPVAVWTGWLIHVGGAEPDAPLSNTPVELGLILATIGAGATLLAQRAVFPATEPEAWRASIGRLVPPLDDGATPPPGDEIDEDALDDEVAAGLQVTEAELAEAQRAAEPAAEAEAEADDASDASVSDEAVTDADDDDANADDAANEADVDATDDSDAVDEPDANTDADSSDDAGAADTHVELPVDADPSPLDEGGHVTEFAAISATDLEAETDSDDDSHDDDSDEQAEPAHADSEAASR